jgi:peptidoglycan/xylan/chitin deacetylase (PgdA/CDA1 family)
MSSLVPFTTSWDDGFPADVRVAEILQSHGLVGTFYASTGPDGFRTISDDDLRGIARHHELGNHGRSHSLFPDLSAAEIESEIRWGNSELSRFGNAGKIVAPPKGRMDPRVANTIREIGYYTRSAPVLGTSSQRVTWVEPTFQFYPHEWKALFRNAARRRLLPTAPLLLAWAKGGEFRERAQSLLRVAAERLPCVHLWGHSWEIDRLDLWDALEDTLRLARRLPMSPMTNTEAAILAREA